MTRLRSASLAVVILAVALFTAACPPPGPPGNKVPNQPGMMAPSPNQLVDGMRYANRSNLVFWVGATDPNPGDKVQVRIRLAHWGSGTLWDSGWLNQLSNGAAASVPTNHGGIRAGQTYIYTVEARDQHGAVGPPLHGGVAVFTDYTPPSQSAAWYTQTSKLNANRNDYNNLFGWSAVSTQYLRDHVANLATPPASTPQNYCPGTLPSGYAAKVSTIGIAPLGNVRGNSVALNSVQTVMREIRVKEPRLADILRTAGMLCYRRIAGTTSVSQHSWGLAIDLTRAGQPAEMYPSGQPGWASNYLIRTWNYMGRAGWYWGAAFSGTSQDNMHFQASQQLLDYWRFVGVMKKA